MKNTYGSTEGWHYTSPLGIVPDLHHALLTNLGGGLAHVGQICSPKLGFGVSAGLTGDFQSMNQATVTDMRRVSVRYENVAPTCLSVIPQYIIAYTTNPFSFSVHA